MAAKRKRVLITGGGTFLGDALAAALLAEGAEVTLLVRPDKIPPEERLGSLADRTRWHSADVWNPASLKGHGRAHAVAIHTIGGMHADPAQGLTYHYLNVVSTRNVAHMCITGGVNRMILMSAARAPWMSPGYIAAKREAEAYLERIGLPHIIIRAPLVYARGHPRPLFYRLMSWLRGVPPFAWIGWRRAAPMPIDILARGVARIALDDTPTQTIFYAPDLRRRNTWAERRRGSAYITQPTAAPRRPIDRIDDEIPFGWTP